jgi:hypothetical protein
MVQTGRDQSKSLGVVAIRDALRALGRKWAGPGVPGLTRRAGGGGQQPGERVMLVTGMGKVSPTTPPPPCHAVVLSPALRPGGAAG